MPHEPHKDSPLPWEVHEPIPRDTPRQLACRPHPQFPNLLADVLEGEEAQQNAEYAVHAANAYPKLVEALKKLYNAIDNSPCDLDSKTKNEIIDSLVLLDKLGEVIQLSRAV